jgi:inosine/xanthosine triphosphatase
MRVAVGSDNPVKRRAVEAALPGDGVPERVTVELVAVDSEVSEQPRGRAETLAGARNRARNALGTGAVDLGIGLEGGVATVEGDPALFVVMWAAATDGDRWGEAAGPSYLLPDPVADRVRAGEELGPVMDDVLGEQQVGRRGGAAAALTGDRVDRATALSTAVAGALGPFVADLYR